MVNDYKDFCQEYMRFCIRLGLVEEDYFEVMSDDEIKTLLKIDHLDYPTDFLIHLKYLGKKSIPGRFGLYYHKGTIESGYEDEKEYVQDMIEAAISDGLKLDESNLKIKPWAERISLKLNLEESNIKIIAEGREHELIMFIDLSVKGIYIHYYDLWKDQVDSTKRLIDSFRMGLYTTASRNYFLDMYRGFRENTLFGKIPWVKYYQSINFSSNLRQEFITKIRAIEEASEITYEIDEFEREFVKFLVENDHAPLKIDIYDPYKDHRTFEEYLP